MKAIKDEKKVIEQSSKIFLPVFNDVQTQQTLLFLKFLFFVSEK